MWFLAVLNLIIGNYGCTDSLAINYDPFATCDNSCNYCTNDTSYTNITACDSLVWNDSTYTQVVLIHILEVLLLIIIQWVLMVIMITSVII